MTLGDETEYNLVALSLLSSSLCFSFFLLIQARSMYIKFFVCTLMLLSALRLNSVYKTIIDTSNKYPLPRVTLYFENGESFSFEFCYSCIFIEIEKGTLISRMSISICAMKCDK